MVSLEELEKRYKELGKEIEAFKESKKEDEEYIESPFKLEDFGDGTLGFPFGNNQVIYYDYTQSLWKVDENIYRDNVKTKIRKEPTSHENLEIGKWYVESNIHNLNHIINEKGAYSLYIGDDTFKFIFQEEIRTTETDVMLSYHEVVVDE